MSDVPTLTLAFLESQPAAAAQVLESLDPADAAAFLEDIPGRMAALALEHMALLPASARVSLLAPATAAGVLRQVPHQRAAGLLRALDAAAAGTILEHLPARSREDFRRSLRYPAGSVGAWMDHRVPALPLERSAGEALDYARQHARDIACHLFLLHPGGELAGSVRLSALLDADPARPLSALLKRELAPLSSSATLHSAAARTEWDHYPVMPVVGRGRKLVGTLSMAVLRRGVEADQRQLGTGGGDSLLMRLAGAYMITCAGLLTLAAGAPPAPAGIDGERFHARQRR